MSALRWRPVLDDRASRHRPRAAWAAFITAAVMSALVVVGVLVPILTLIGAAAGLTAGTLRVPVGPIALAIALGYVLAILLLVMCLRSRVGALSWVLGVAAVISTLSVSVWPIVVVALAGVQQVQDVVPFIRQLVARVLAG